MNGELPESGGKPAALEAGDRPAPGVPVRRGGQLASAALVVMVFFILSRVAGLAREMVIGARFGTSADLDAYLAAFRVPDLLFQLVAGGALGSAFIPTFAGYWVQGDEGGAWLLFSRVLNLLVLCLSLLSGLTALFALPLMTHVIAPGFSPAQQQMAAQLMRWMLVSTVVFGVSGLMMGTLNATQHFLLPAAAPLFYNLAIIAGAWWLAPHWGVYGLVAGVVAGAFAHLLVQLPGLWRYQAQYRWSLGLADAGVREVLRLMGPRVLGLLFVQLHFLVNTILASNLQAGSLSALNYAWLLMLLPQGIFAQALATVAFPTFSAQVAAGRRDELRETFGQILRVVLFFTIPAAAGLYVLRQPLIQLLLERREFDARSTAMVAYALQFYALGLVAHAGVEIAVRAFYALHDTATPVWVGVAAMVLNILLSLWWVQYLSHGGLALANSAATTLEFLCLLGLLRRRLGGLALRTVAVTLGRCGGATLAMAAAVVGWLQMMNSLGPALGAGVSGWLPAVGGMVLAAVVYLGGSLALGSGELSPVWRMVQRRLGTL